MISPVSFGSTYKIHSQNLGDDANRKKHFNVMDYCDKQGIDIRTEESWGEQKSPISIPEYSVKTTIIAPDSQDKNLEAFFSVLGIDFKKHSTEDLMNPKAIEKRVMDAPKGMRTVKIDPDKLFSLIDKQPINNIEHCESDYKTYYKDNTDFMLKSGDEIPATTLYLNPFMGSEKALEYLKRFGEDTMNRDSMSVDFSQRTDDPDHCMFFAMIDAGLSEVPVYVDKDSYAVGKAMGLFC